MKADVRRRVAAVATALMLAGLALGSAGSVRAADPSIRGKAAVDFALKSVGGQNMRLSEHLGEVVLLNFWATWCGPCRQQMPRLDQLHATYRSAGLVLLGLNVDDDTEAAAEFVRTLGVSYPVLLDPRKSVAPQYDVDALPMTVLVDRAGVVRFVHYDYSPAIEKQYISELRQLLDE